jgi:hypothetical protein
MDDQHSTLDPKSSGLRKVAGLTFFGADFCHFRYNEGRVSSI